MSGDQAQQEKLPIPPATLWDQLRSYFTRQDTLMAYMAETQRQLLALFRAYTGLPAAPPVIVTPPSGPPVLVSIAPIDLSALIPAPLPVMAEPLGRVRKFNTTTYVTTTSFAEVIGYAPTSGKEWQFAYFTISADQDVLVKVVWGSSDLTQTYYVMAKVPFVMWLPPKFYNTDGKPIIGDGKTKLSLQAMMPSGGTATTYCFGEIAGDEV